MSVLGVTAKTDEKQLVRDSAPSGGRSWRLSWHGEPAEGVEMQEDAVIASLAGVRNRWRLCGRFQPLRIPLRALTNPDETPFCRVGAASADAQP